MTTTTDTRPRHTGRDSHAPPAGAGSHIPDGQPPVETQRRDAVGEPELLNGQDKADTHDRRAGEHPAPQPTSLDANTNETSSAGAQDSGHQELISTQGTDVAAPTPLAVTQEGPVTHRGDVSRLADPLLALAADVLDDLERVRIANENRLRQLTRDETDKDGEERGFGLTTDHPDVARLAALVDALKRAEHDATLNLQRMVRKHPLGAFIKAAKGIGEKQGARLLAAIGDPYWNDLHDRPRTVSELWAYCGYHVLPVGQSAFGTHWWCADGDPSSARHPALDTHPSSAGGDPHPTSHRHSYAHSRRAGGDLTGGCPDQPVREDHRGVVRVAATRARGQKANWSATARMRARLISESIIKAGGPYREVYDHGRAKYTDSVHKVECKRCGPAGKPAPAGSPLSDGHKHARALRLVSKTVLKDLWLEAKRLHKLHSGRTPTDNQKKRAAGGQS